MKSRNILFFIFLMSCSADSSRTPDPEPITPIRTCGVELEFSGPATDVSVSGEFNDWGETTLSKKDDVWRAHVEAPPGHYAYIVRVDGLELDPPASATTQWFEAKNSGQWPRRPVKCRDGTRRRSSPMGPRSVRRLSFSRPIPPKHYWTQRPCASRLAPLSLERTLC